MDLTPGELKLVAHWLAQPLTLSPGADDFAEIVAAIASLKERIAGAQTQTEHPS